MAGIFFIAVVIAWLCVAVWLTSFATRRIERKWVRLLTTGLLFVGLMVLPVVDEIIGGAQFRTLCEQNAKLQINAEKIKGKNIRVTVSPSNEILSGKMLTIYHSHLSFGDVDLNEELAYYDRYEVKGGWLVRVLGISESTSPLTIEPSYCAPPNRGMLPQNYNFNLIN